MVHKEDLLEMFITYDLEDLYGDFSDDGDGELELTEKGEEVAATILALIEQELSKAREEGYKKGYIDGQTEKTNKPKPVISEFDKTSYLN